MKTPKVPVDLIPMPLVIWMCACHHADLGRTLRLDTDNNIRGVAWRKSWSRKASWGWEAVSGSREGSKKMVMITMKMTKKSHLFNLKFNTNNNLNLNNNLNII